ncbi:MAG: NADH-quinone oxidoreductase subunit A [Thermoanaerobaculaceae bacterium]|jgi:NADH:ubiquinone oxidoreductase subunit 3 (subunit A)
MIAQYIPVVMAFAFAAVVVGALVGLTTFLGRGRLRGTRTRDTYESGMPLLDSSRKRVSIRFFVVAMVFIVFDVEVAFLFPWAVSVRGLLAEGNSAVLLDGLIFLVLLAIGYVYLWREGAFDWSRRRSES